VFLSIQLTIDVFISVYRTFYFATLNCAHLVVIVLVNVHSNFYLPPVVIFGMTVVIVRHLHLSVEDAR
jgi:hypothetical protein